MCGWERPVAWPACANSEWSANINSCCVESSARPVCYDLRDLREVAVGTY